MKNRLLLILALLFSVNSVVICQPGIGIGFAYTEVEIFLDDEIVHSRISDSILQNLISHTIYWTQPYWFNHESDSYADPIVDKSTEINGFKVLLLWDQLHNQYIIELFSVRLNGNESFEKWYINLPRLSEIVTAKDFEAFIRAIPRGIQNKIGNDGLEPFPIPLKPNVTARSYNVSEGNLSFDDPRLLSAVILNQNRAGFLNYYSNLSLSDYISGYSESQEIFWGKLEENWPFYHPYEKVIKKNNYSICLYETWGIKVEPQYQIINESDFNGVLRINPQIEVLSYSFVDGPLIFIKVEEMVKRGSSYSKMNLSIVETVLNNFQRKLFTQLNMKYLF